MYIQAPSLLVDVSLASLMKMDCRSFCSYGSDCKPCSRQYNPANWIFDPEQSTNTPVYHTAGTILDPEYFRVWVGR
jgi:hypothetical protein